MHSLLVTFCEHMDGQQEPRPGYEASKVITNSAPSQKPSAP